MDVAISAVVVDASAILSWMIADEGDALAGQMAGVVAAVGGFAPALLRWEVQNALLIAVRRGRLAQETCDAQLADLDELQLSVDGQVVSMSHTRGVDLARRFALSAYDAAYLELASRLRRPLMTRDARLAAAAREIGLLWEPPL
jgi:predicted nucleic acid-binding protein